MWMARLTALYQRFILFSEEKSRWPGGDLTSGVWIIFRGLFLVLSFRGLRGVDHHTMSTITPIQQHRKCLSNSWHIQIFLSGFM